MSDERSGDDFKVVKLEVRLDEFLAWVDFEEGHPVRINAEKLRINEWAMRWSTLSLVLCMFAWAGSPILNMAARVWPLTHVSLAVVEWWYPKWFKGTNGGRWSLLFAFAHAFALFYIFYIFNMLGN